MNHVSLAFPPSKPFLALFQSHCLICVCICVCKYTYMYIYVYISKYSLLSLYNVTCIYVFRTDHLALDKPWVCSSLGKTTSPTLRILELLVL